MGSIQNPVKITVGDGKVPDNQLPLYATLVNADGTPFTGGSSGPSTVTSADISDASPIGREVLKAVSAEAVRSKIGAGTSSVTIGTTSTQAKPGDYSPSSAEVSNGLKAKAQIAALANAANAAGETVTPAEFNALVAKVNAVIAALKA